MVYIRNILAEFDKLTGERILYLNMKSGSQHTIRFGDKVEKCNGEIKINRLDHNANFLCEFIVDCAEVESIVLSRRI